jgi:hypothetical protein
LAPGLKSIEEATTIRHKNLHAFEGAERLSGPVTIATRLRPIERHYSHACVARFPRQISHACSRKIQMIPPKVSGATKPHNMVSPKGEIDRMASAFEHDDLKAALAAK